MCKHPVYEHRVCTLCTCFLVWRALLGLVVLRGGFEVKVLSPCGRLVSRLCDPCMLRSLALSPMSCPSAGVYRPALLT